MKKVRLIVIVLVITSMAIIFLKNIKPFLQAENLSLNENVYNFLQDKGNRIAVYSAAVEFQLNRKIQIKYYITRGKDNVIDTNIENISDIDLYVKNNALFSIKFPKQSINNP